MMELFLRTRFFGGSCFSSLQCFRVLFLCIFKLRGCLPSPHCAVPLEATDALPLLVYDRDQALSLDSRGLVLLGSLTHNAVFSYHWESLQGSCQTLLADFEGLVPALETLLRA